MLFLRGSAPHECCVIRCAAPVAWGGLWLRFDCCSVWCQRHCSTHLAVLGSFLHDINHLTRALPFCRLWSWLLIARFQVHTFIGALLEVRCLPLDWLSALYAKWAATTWFLLSTSCTSSRFRIRLTCEECSGWDEGFLDSGERLLPVVFYVPFFLCTLIWASCCFRPLVLIAIRTLK